MEFMSGLKNMFNGTYNVSVTENGALGYRTTGKKLLDLNFAVSSLRSAKESEIMNRFMHAYFENPRLALKWLMYAADVRCGMGERRLFHVVFQYFARNHIDIATAMLSLVPEYTRWDHVAELLDTPLADEAAKMILEQLRKDVENMEKGKSVSLCAKWLPSENASSERDRTLARILARKLSMTNKQYRKMLSMLRKYLKVVEVSMSNKDWADIDYTAVPSMANVLYNRAFLRNDEDRRREFLGSLQRNEVKIHSDVLFPHDIVHSYFGVSSNGVSRVLKPEDVALEAMWNSLPDYVQGAGNTLCVADGSGSMTIPLGGTKVQALEVANALAIYFAQRCTGQFKDYYITFSQSPKLVDLSQGKTLRDKIEIARHHNEVANTNIEAVFDLILQNAFQHRMSQADLPANILILSDMEFDVGTRLRDGSKPDARLFESMAKKYAAYGYRLPRLIFWNLNSRTKTIPLKENELGVVLVSGFSPAVLKMVMNGETDPYEALVKQLDDKRYDAVEQVLKRCL